MESDSLVLVTKSPQLGVVKTRLAATIGSERALEFAKASLSDLLSRLATEVPKSVSCVLLFAPASERDALQSLVDSLGSQVSVRWKLKPMVEGELQSPDLGFKLASCLKSTTSKGVTVFIGSDCVEIPSECILEAIEVGHSGEAAYICPAVDGGYTLLGLPQHCSTDVFSNVHWSSSDTCSTQEFQIQLCGLQLRKGPTFADVDELTDIVDLRKRLKQPHPPFPRTAMLLRKWEFCSAPSES